MAIRRADLAEASSIIGAVLEGLQDGLPPPSAQPPSANAAQLQWAIGQLQTTITSEIVTGAIWPDLLIVFDLSRASGCSYVAMDAIRQIAAGFAPASRLGIALANYAVRLALSELAQILAATTFLSVADADTAAALIGPAFDSAIEIAADNADFICYQTLVALKAASFNDLASRSQKLPSIVTYNFNQSVTALWLAQRIYQDASRAADIASENNVLHPLFMNSPIRALSS